MNKFINSKVVVSATAAAYYHPGGEASQLDCLLFICVSCEMQRERKKDEELRPAELFMNKSPFDKCRKEHQQQQQARSSYVSKYGRTYSILTDGRKEKDEVAAAAAAAAAAKAKQFGYTSS